jgi:four helix bundle protein
MSRTSSQSKEKERVGVYEESLRFAVLIDEVVEQLEARYSAKDLLDRSATLVAMRIAQAAAELNKDERRAHYKAARQAATDCASLLDVLSRRGNGSAASLEAAKRAVLTLLDKLSQLAVGDSFSGEQRKRGTR